MAPWQVLRAGKATQAALGYRVHHGPGGLVHYSTAPAAAAAAAAAAVAPDSSSRSFCLSREKVTMQQLNRRLASYLQQVQCLEAANQKLESQIQKELDKKCPGELRHLDGHLRTVSLLQEQMSDCLSAQAQVKLQLLSAELTVFDLNIRYEKERERRGCLEAELSDLRLLEEELCVHRLPELQSLLMEQTQELNELQIEHQQNMQGLLADMSGGVTVEMQPAESSDLIQQLDDLRQTSVTLLDKNQDEFWFNAQVSMLNSPEVTFGPPAGSEVIQAELEEVRRRAASLEEELTHLKSMNMVLEASGREQNESFVQQLVVLQQRADSLCNDLDSVLQAAAQQAAEYQNLLDIKTRLETEIQDYMKLLDGLSPQGVSSLQFKSAANITSSCVTTSPSTFRRNITGRETAGLQGGNFRMMEVQDISRGHIRTVGKTPIVAPLSQTVTTVQSVRVQQRKHAKTSPVTSMNSSNVTSSFHKSEKQRTVVPPEMTKKGSMPLSATVNRQGSPVEDKFHTKDCDLKNSSIVGTQSSQGLDKGVVVKASKLETNTAKGTTMLVSAAVEMKPETFTSKQTTTEAALQTNKIETKIQTVITKTIPCVEQDMKQGPNFGTHTTTIDPSKCIATERKKDTEIVISAQLNCTEGPTQGKLQDPPQVKSLNLETQAEAIRDVAITASVLSGSHILTSQEAQGKVSGDLNLFGDKDMERQKKNRKEEVDGTSTVLGLDVSSTLSDASKSKQNKDMEDADTRSGIAIPSSGSPDSKDNLESKTEQGTITLVPDTQPARSADVQAKPVTFTSNQTTTEAGLQTYKTEVITKTITCVEPEVKQEPNFAAHMTKSDPNKQTAAEVKRETEAGVQATEVETNVQTVISKTSPCVEPEGKRGPNFVAQTTAPDSSRQTAAEVKKETKSVILALRLDKSTDLSDASNIKQNKDMEDVNTRSGIGITSSSSPDSNDNLDNKSAQGIITLGPEKQSVMNAVVQTKPETSTSNQITTEPNKTETNIKTVITKTITCAEPEVKQGPNTETVISAQINCTEDSICVKHKDPAQVASLCLETPAEAVEDAGEVAIKASAQVKVSDNLTLMDDKDTERQEKKGEEEVVDQILSLSDVSNTKQNTDVEDADTGSGTATVSSSSPDSNDNLGSKNASTESLRKVELVKKTVNNLHHTKDVKGDPTELDNEMVILAEQEALLSTMELKKRTRRNDSGVALSSSNSEGLLSPTKDHVFPTTTETVACVNPEICLSPDETEVLMSVTDQVFCPVDLEERVLSPSDSGTCLSPVEAKVCPSPNGDEEDEEVCLSLTEANTHVRPVEKYILSTKEEGQSLSFSREQVLPEVDRNRNGSVSMRGGESLCFGSLEGNKGSRGTVNGTSNSKPTSQGISLQMSSSGMVRDVAANLGTADASSSGNTGSKESPSGATHSNRGSGEWMVYGGSLGCKRSLPRTKSEESPSAAMLLATSPPKTSFGSRGSGVVSSSSPKHTSFLAGNDSLPNTESREGLPSAMRRAISPPGTVKFGSRGSGEWRVYGGSTGRISSWAGSDNLPTADREGNPSATAQLPVSPPGSIGAEKFGSRGSGEWRVYGGNTGRISSWAGSDNLPTADRKGNPSVATQLPVSPPGSIGAGKFGSRGSGEWRVYGGNTGRISSWAGSHNLPTADRKGNPSVAAQLPISPPGSIGGGKFGSRGSGEFRVYGGSTGRISSWAGSHNLATADRKENPSVAAQLPISPPGSIGAGRFGSGGSGEWRVYGGSSGRLSSAGNADRVSVGENCNEMVSPPSSYTSSRLRRSSSGSSGRLGLGSVIRRSSSVGSGGRLSSSGSGGKLSSSSGSNRTSTSGRFSSTASGECKPVYSSASGRKSTVGSAGRSGGGGTIGSQRAPSPGGRMSASTGSGGWLSSSAANGTCNSSSGSGSKLSSAGGSDRVSSRTGGRISSSSGSGRTNSMGGRVISSSDRPIRSTGSGTGGNKERISVCKMAALSMSAAGRERSEDRQRQAQRHQQQQAAGTSPLLQRWLSSGDEVKTATSDGLDDIMRL